MAKSCVIFFQEAPDSLFSLMDSSSPSFLESSRRDLSYGTANYWLNARMPGIFLYLRCPRGVILTPQPYSLYSARF